MKLIRVLQARARGYAASISVLAVLAVSHTGTHRQAANAGDLFTTMQKSFESRTKDTCAPVAPIETNLRFANQAQVGVANELIFNVATFEEGKNAEIFFDIPRNMRILGGDIRTKLDLTKNNARTFRLPVRIDHFGDFEVMASVICGEPEYRFGRRMHLYVRATEAGVEVSDDKTLIYPEVEIPVPTNSPDVVIKERTEGDSPAGPALPWTGKMTHDPDGRPLDTTREGDVGPAVSTTVNGTFSYYHDDGTNHGAYGARILAWDDDIFSADDYLGDSIVSPSGAYSITFDNNQDGGLEPGTADVYLEFRTENGAVNVTNGSGSVYAASTGVVWPDISGGTHTANWNYGNGSAYERRYEVLDYLSTAWAHGNYVMGHNAHFTRCNFENSWTNGSYYQTGSNQIWIHGEHYSSPDVIMHEFGHSYHDSINGDSYWPPGAGGSHSLTGHYNPGLALTEGYGTYFACTAQGNEWWYDDRSAFNTIHFDCDANWDGNGSANGNSDNLSNAPNYGYDTESAVLSLLLDIDDGRNSTTDPYDWSTFGDDEIQDVMDNYSTGGHPCAGIQDFYNGWKARGHPYIPKLNGQFHVHGMNQGISNPFLGLSSGVSLYSSTVYYGGYSRGSYYVKNYGSINYNLNQCYVWLRGPAGQDIGQYGGDGNGAAIASGAERQVWETADQTGYNPASPNFVYGTYTVTAGHYRSDSAWQLLDPAESGTDRQVNMTVIKDTDAPDYCTVVDDGDCQNSATTLHIYATANDYDSSIAGYWTRVGTTAGSGNEQDWVFHAANNQTTFDYTITGLSMNANTTYYVTVVARNIEGYDTWAYTDGIIAWDATPPGAVTVTDDGAFTPTLTQLHVHATSSEPDGCIAGYWTRIGTSPGAGNTQDWIYHATGDVDVFDKNLTGLSLTVGVTYYITVVARNMSGLDTFGYSDGIVAGNRLTGRVVLQNWTASYAGMPVTIRIRNVGGAADLDVRNTTLDASGNFTIYTGVAPGNRDLYCKSTHWLQRKRANHSIPATGGIGANFTLINGDADPDNEKNLVDWGIFAAAFGKAIGEAGYNWWADLDGDGEVTLVDGSLISSGFGTAGDE